MGNKAKNILYWYRYHTRIGLCPATARINALITVYGNPWDQDIHLERYARYWRGRVS